jgi:hypothetical protein
MSAHVREITGLYIIELMKFIANVIVAEILRGNPAKRTHFSV